MAKTKNDAGAIKAINVEDILRGTAHALTIFKPKAIAALAIYLKDGKPYLTCYATGKERPAKPEEIVRQLYVKMLMDDYGYAASRIAIVLQHHFFGRTFGWFANQVLRCELVACLLRSR